LAFKIGHDTVDLLYHRLRQDFRLSANLQRRDRTSVNEKASLSDCSFAGNELTERTVTSPPLPSKNPIGSVNDLAIRLNAAYKLW